MNSLTKIRLKCHRLISHFQFLTKLTRSLQDLTQYCIDTREWNAACSSTPHVSPPEEKNLVCMAYKKFRAS